MSIEIGGHDSVLQFMLWYLGKESQVNKLKEEMEELSEELSLSIDDRNEARIIDEIADVFITLHQLKIAYGPSKVMERIYHKINLLQDLVKLSQEIEKLIYPAFEEDIDIDNFRKKLWTRYIALEGHYLVKCIYNNPDLSVMELFGKILEEEKEIDKYGKINLRS